MKTKYADKVIPGEYVYVNGEWHCITRIDDLEDGNYVIYHTGDIVPVVLNSRVMLNILENIEEVRAWYGAGQS